MTESLARRIEKELAEWHNQDSPARLRFEQLQSVFDARFENLKRTIEESERLTERDLMRVIAHPT